MKHLPAILHAFSWLFPLAAFVWAALTCDMALMGLSLGFVIGRAFEWEPPA